MATRILTVNIGSSQLTMGEFALSRQSGLELHGYAVAPLGLEPGTETDPSAFIVSTIRDIMRSRGIKPGKVLMSISGKDIFPRFVKLPPVSNDKIENIVYYEAQQNVPFAIDEVIWDYQLVTDEENVRSVMLVAVKKEVVKRHTNAVEAAGLEPVIVDCAPMALYNLVRFNYGESAACIMVVDIGARSTNLIFVEKKRIFCRSIPVAGHSITQEIMRDFDLSFKEAEQLKLEHGFVAQGGPVGDGDSQVINRVSKTVRNVMTKLHAEVTRSVNFYRSQQNGSKPSLVLISGGSAVIPGLDQFLREKLATDVEFLNPFQNVAVNNSIPTEDVAANMHLLGEVTGLALRQAYSCPMEMNLMPDDLAARRRLKGRMPFFLIASLAVFVNVLCWWVAEWKFRHMVGSDLDKAISKLADLNRKSSVIATELIAEQEISDTTQRMIRLVEERTRWITMIKDIHSNLAEGMWITSITPSEERDEAGRPMRLNIRGMGFLDQVKDATVVGEFCNRLKDKKFFSDDVQVGQIQYPADYALEFTVSIGMRRNDVSRDGEGL